MAASPAPGPLALVGSGEYLPQMAEIEEGLLTGRPPRYVQLATAAVPDGASVVSGWHRLGAEQAARLGVEAVAVPVNNRADADDPSLVALIRGAGLIYLSGGKPAYLADTLRDTRMWATIVAAWQAGAALAGCSAGAMAMTSWVPSLRPAGASAVAGTGPRPAPGTAGLGLLPHLRVIPHFDTFTARVPDLVAQLLSDLEPGLIVLGIEEETALVGGPQEWSVQGHRSVWRLTPETRDRLPSGPTLTTPTGPHP